MVDRIRLPQESGGIIEIEVTDEEWEQLLAKAVADQQNGATLLPHESLSPTTITFVFSSGPIVRYPRRPIPTGELRSSHRMEGDRYLYEYVFDNRQTQAVLVGDPEESFPDSILEGPRSWISSGTGWTAWMDAERSGQARYTILTDRLPGLMRMTFSGEDLPVDDLELPGDLTPFQRKHVMSIVRQHVNSTDRYVIGPAFGPEPVETEVRGRIQRWVVDYGFTFLEPFNRPDKPLQEWDCQAKPFTEFEAQVLDCLKLTIRSIVG